MEIIRNSEFRIDYPTAICIGKFDGVHLGHLSLLRLVVEQKKRGLIPTVFTFNPSPETVFNKEKRKEIYTIGGKEELLKELGIDILIEYPFDTKVSQILPEEFVHDILIKQAHMAYIAAGEDISFGRGGKGDRELMEKLGDKLGFEVNIIQKLKIKGDVVSSSRIKEELEKGNLEMAQRLLGREYK